ncbi:MAG: hypothetical protein JWM10_2363 [Myxococcaceae bacterium]|nr:hypothetical protein [Myxococcaceae bacterium]
MRARSLAGVMLAARALAACGPGPSLGTVVTRSDVRQAGLVASPSPAMAASPLTPLNRFALEGGFEAGVPGGAANATSSARSAQVTSPLSLHLRGFYRPTRLFELGAALEIAPPVARSATSADVDPAPFDGVWLLRAGLQARLVFNPDDRVIVGMGFGMSLGAVEAFRRVTTTVTNNPVGGAPTTTTYPPSGSTGSRPYPWMSTSLFLSGRPSRRVSVLGGLAVQNQPVVIGSRTTSLACTTYDGGGGGLTSTSCDGEVARSVPLVRTEARATLFATTALRTGPVWLVFRADFVLPTSEAASSQGLFGAGLDLRYVSGD